MIPHCSHVATELTALTKKGAEFKWTPNCQAAFETLKAGTGETSHVNLPKLQQALPNLH
jgi:hypothetical protein